MLQRLLAKQLDCIPTSQPFYTFSSEAGDWISSTQDTPPGRATGPVSSLAVISWNIDFMAPEPRARMASALNHLEHVISTMDPSTAVVVLLQEMMETRGTMDGANDLSQIADAAWVQARFCITDLDSRAWSAPYGQVTLVDRRLCIERVARLQLVSEFGRDALLVDVRLNAKASGSFGAQTRGLMRLCNVHLDSMSGQVRPVQWKGVAQHLQDSSACVAASILAGDCNANRPRDATEPQRNGFRDSYLELGGVEDADEGLTWGYQSMGWERWGRSRMDKQVFWGDVAVNRLEKIGVGVEVKDGAARMMMKRQGKLTYVTDHFGLMGLYTVEGGFEVNMEGTGVEQQN